MPVQVAAAPEWPITTVSAIAPIDRQTRTKPKTWLSSLGQALLSEYQSRSETAKVISANGISCSPYSACGFGSYITSDNASPDWTERKMKGTVAAVETIALSKFFWRSFAETVAVIK